MLKNKKGFKERTEKKEVKDIDAGKLCVGLSLLIAGFPYCYPSINIQQYQQLLLIASRYMVSGGMTVLSGISIFVFLEYFFTKK